MASSEGSVFRECGKIQTYDSARLASCLFDSSGVLMNVFSYVGRIGVITAVVSIPETLQVGKGCKLWVLIGVVVAVAVAHKFNT